MKYLESAPFSSMPANQNFRDKHPETFKSGSKLDSTIAKKVTGLPTGDAVDAASLAGYQVEVFSLDYELSSATKEFNAGRVLMLSKRGKIIRAVIG